MPVHGRKRLTTGSTTWRFCMRDTILAFSILDGPRLILCISCPANSLILFGGAKGSRTPDLLNAIQALSQLSYGPTRDAGLGTPRPKSLLILSSLDARDQ